MNEVETRRATKLSAWLTNNVDNPPPLEDLIDPASDYVAVDRFDGADAIRALRDLQPDYIVSGGAGIVRQNILEIAPVLNAHPGLLPEYRGATPVLWAISNHDPIGATLHQMDEEIDTGPLLIRRELEPGPANSVMQLRLRAMRLASDLLAEFLRNPEGYPPTRQYAGRSFTAFCDGDHAQAEEKLAAHLAFYHHPEHKIATEG
ncbi:MAG: hypothetical protein HQ495_15610 [Alphaproteobacteria bacterium]|nr:hypothetical protein [Alphaproteobacteria bacterium]